jgi:ribosomal-protein-alanine N-acetyltransferase
VDALELRPFVPEQAELVSSWAPTADEVRRWVSRDTVPVPPEVVRGWADEEDSLTFVAHLDGEPVGFGQLWIEDDEDDAEVARLLVAPQHRGRGTGRALVLALAEVAQRYKPSVALRVVPDNTQAIRAYAAAGFARMTPQEESVCNERQPVEYVWMRLRPPQRHAGHDRRGRVPAEGYASWDWREGLDGLTDRLSAGGRTEDVDAALAFLDRDVHALGSGYLAEALLHRLGRVPLDQSRSRRVHDLVLLRLREPRPGWDRPLFRLAATVWDDDLAARVAALAQHPDEVVRRRADRLRERVDHLHRSWSGRRPAPS